MYRSAMEQLNKWKQKPIKTSYYPWGASGRQNVAHERVWQDRLRKNGLY